MQGLCPERRETVAKTWNSPACSSPCSSTGNADRQQKPRVIKLLHPSGTFGNSSSSQKSLRGYLPHTVTLKAGSEEPPREGGRMGSAEADLFCFSGAFAAHACCCSWADRGVQLCQLSPSSGHSLETVP